MTLPNQREESNRSIKSEKLRFLQICLVGPQDGPEVQLEFMKWSARNLMPVMIDEHKWNIWSENIRSFLAECCF